MNNLLICIVSGTLAILMTKSLVRDLRAMHEAPKGRKIEAYYTSAKGYNPYTGEPGRTLK